MRCPQISKLDSVPVVAAEARSGQNDPGRSNAVHDVASALTFRGSPSEQSSITEHKSSESPTKLSGLPYDFDKTTRGLNGRIWQRTAVGEKDHDIFVLPIGCATLAARVAAEA